MELLTLKPARFPREIIFFALILIFFVPVSDLKAQGFSNTKLITPVAASKNTADKPQSKVWKNDGKWFTVFPTTAGTFIWRLDGTVWTSVLRLNTATTTRADCKVVGNVVHIFLWRKEGTASQLFSVEYVPASSTYKLWSKRTTGTSVTLENGTETGTIDIDGNGRMWLTNDSFSNIMVRYSDYPYSSWSAPFVLASGTEDDDICTVIALPNQHQVGILWSNQNTKRFGFKTHNDNDPANVWSNDEAPGANKAYDNIGGGLGDDHMNMKYASDGTVYAAVKTSYDTKGYPRLSLFKRFSDGTWSDLYEVSETGTRSMVLLNETTRKLKVVFSEVEDGGNIYYKESSMDNISFGPRYLLLSGVYNNSSSSKENYSSDVVIIASTVTVDCDVVGVLATDGATPSPSIPTLITPADQATSQGINTLLNWNTVANAASFSVQVSDASDFSNLVVDQSGITGNSYQVSNLSYNKTYFWRVLATNQTGSSDWSAVYSFSTINPYPGAPTTSSPANMTVGIATNPSLTWAVGANATSYNVQVSLAADFSTTVINQAGITSTSYQASALANNTAYFWRVQSVNQFGVSAYSTTSSFTTIIAAPGAPALVAPANAMTGLVTNPLFSWNAATNAASYTLQVSSSSSFLSFAINQSGLTATNYQASGLSFSATYYWRVLASNAGGNTLSSVNSFTTQVAAPATPTLTNPANNATSVTIAPTLSWNTSANAVSYNVQVALVSDFSTTLVNQTGITSTSYQTSALANSTTYFWRVQSVNQSGVSAYSATSSFTTIIAAPDAPALVAPANSVTGLVTNPLFSWNAAANAASYTLQVSSSSSFSTFAINQSGLTATNYQSSGLSFSATYYWRVLASNAGGNTLSSVNSFATQVAPPSTPTLVSPANNETSVELAPSLTWNAALDAAYYNVQLSSVSDFSTLIVNQSNVTGTSVAITGLANGTIYYWRVQAVNSTASSQWSADSKFTTVFITSGNNMVGYWAMNESSGSTLNDYSSFLNTGALVGGPARVTGIAGSAVRLSGVQQYGSVPDANSLDISQSITLAAWIKPEKLSSMNVIKKGTTGGEDGYELTLLSTGKIQFRFNQNSSSLYNLNSNGLYPTDGNTWMHIAATYSSAVVKIYINGVLNKSVTFTTPPPIATNSQPLLIGGPNMFTGSIDEVRVYNYALDATQIAAIATPGNSSISATGRTAEVAVMEETTGELNFYPNPVVNMITIDFNGEDNKDVVIAIADTQGRIHYQQSPPVEDNKVEINADELNLSSGIHLLIVKTQTYQKVFKFYKK